MFTAPKPLFRIAASHVDEPMVMTKELPALITKPVAAVATTALDVPNTINTGDWLTLEMTAIVGVPVVGMVMLADVVVTGSVTVAVTVIDGMVETAASTDDDANSRNAATMSGSIFLIATFPYC